MDPLVALAVGLLAILIVGVSLYPRTGLLARLRRAALQNDRVRTEDALKFLTRSQEGEASLTTVAGALNLSSKQVHRLSERMRHQGLITVRDGSATLTPVGRRIGAQIVRAHRLWEQYLADETGYAAEEWHDRAEEQEHFLTLDEADELSRSLGHPTYDPHGEPIPTAEGRVPSGDVLPAQRERYHSPTLRALSDLAPGQRGEVVALSSTCRGLERRRLQDLGVLPGTEIRVELTAVGGDPRAYRIREALIALRDDQADRILVEPQEVAA